MRGVRMIHRVKSAGSDAGFPPKVGTMTIIHGKVVQVSRQKQEADYRMGCAFKSMFLNDLLGSYGCVGC